MSVLNLFPKIILSGNGMDKVFAFPFPAKEKTDIKVFVLREGADKETQIPYGQFDFNIDPTENTGGEIVFPGENSEESLLSNKDKICILRESKLGNDYIFTNQTRLLPQTVEDADDSLALQILELSRDLAMSVKVSPFDSRTPQERWQYINTEIKKAQEILNYINEEFVVLPEKLALEQQTRENADENILQQISENKLDCNEKISQLSKSLEQETSERKASDELSVPLKNLSIAVTDVSLDSEDKSSVTVKINNRLTKTGGNYPSRFTLPVVSELRHGLMPKEAYSELSGLSSRVSSLETGQAKSYAVRLGYGPFTQEDYQRAWELASGEEQGSVPPDGTRLTNLDTNLDVQYFSTQSLWIERNVSVPIATANSTGVVKGANDDGKIAVEQDGTMSLNGYDALVNKSSNNESLISAEVQRATSAEESTSEELQNHILNDERHLAAEERATWNSKYLKPDTGIPIEDLSSSVRTKLSDAVSKSNGGTVAGKLVARNATEAGSVEVRNISFTDVDPGSASNLATGTILMVFE